MQKKRKLYTNTWMRRRKGNSNFIKSIYLKVEKSTYYHETFARLINVNTFSIILANKEALCVCNFKLG